MDEDIPVYDLFYVGAMVLLGLFVVGVFLSMLVTLTIQIIGGTSSSSPAFCGLAGAIYSYVFLLLLFGDWFLVPNFETSDLPFPVAGIVLGVLLSYQWKSMVTE